MMCDFFVLNWFVYVKLLDVMLFVIGIVGIMVVLW